MLKQKNTYIKHSDNFIHRQHCCCSINHDPEIVDLLKVLMWSL